MFSQPGLKIPMATKATGMRPQRRPSKIRKDLSAQHSQSQANMDVHTEADRLAEEVNLIDEINSSARFSQMKIYTDNFKYEKALAVID